MNIQCVILWMVLLLISNMSLAYKVTDNDSVFNKKSRGHVAQKSAKKDIKYLRTATFIKIQSANGYAVMRDNHSPFKIQPNVGTGIELSVGKKVSSKLTLGLGLNSLAYNVDQTALYQSVFNHYQEPSFGQILTSYNRCTLAKTGLFALASSWFYRPHYVLELYGKLAATHASYKMDFISFKHNLNTHLSEYYILKDQYQSWGMMPSAGVHASVNLSSAIYATFGAEYGYNICADKTIRQQYITNTGISEFQFEKVPIPAHFFQLNLGIMIHPFNRIHPNEPEYKEPDFEQRTQRNN